MTLRFFKGFTMVEVLIVVAIAGILATAGVVMWGKNIPGRGRDAQRVADVNNIKLAVEAFFEENHRYPPLGPAYQPYQEEYFFSDQTPPPWLPEITPFIKDLPKDPKQNAQNPLVRLARDILEKLRIENAWAVHTEALNLKNVMKIESGTYTGTGADQQIAVGFRSDMVLVKGGGTDANSFAAMSTSTMAGMTKSVGRQTLVFANGIKSLDNFGFTVGTGCTLDSKCKINLPGVIYYYLAVQNKAGQFNVVTYGGNGSTQPVSVGFLPDMVLIMPSYDRKSVWKTSTMPAGQSQVIDQTLISGMITDFTADGFTVVDSVDTDASTQSSVNKNLVTYYAIAVRSTLNAFNVLSYTGNNDCPPNQEQSIVGAGFQPDAVWVKGNKAVNGSLRFQDHPYKFSSTFDENDDQNDMIRYFEPDGFHVRGSAVVNYKDPVTCIGTAYHAVAWNETSVSNPYFYLYHVSADRRSYNVWGTFENKKHPSIFYHSEAQCKIEPPIGGFNYCGGGF